MSDTVSETAPGWADAEVTHFYSYVTGVSIELPLGFEEVGQDEVSATYADLGDHVAPEPGDAVVRVRVAAVLDTEPTPDARARAATELADALAGNGEQLSRERRTVDEEQVETVVVRQADGTVLHQTAACAGRRLLAVVATVERDDLLAAYDRSIGSIRFIDL